MSAGIGESLYTVAAAAASGGMILTLLGRKGKVTEVMRYLLSLVLILMFVTPLYRTALSAGALLLHTEDIGLPASRAEEMTVSAAGALAERELSLMLARETGVPINAITVSLSLDSGNADEVIITESTLNVSDKRYRIAAGEMRQRLEELLSCPCRVSFDKKTEAS